jgi:hypothetical protein
VAFLPSSSFEHGAVSLLMAPITIPRSVVRKVTSQEYYSNFNQSSYRTNFLVDSLLLGDRIQSAFRKATKSVFSWPVKPILKR